MKLRPEKRYPIRLLIWSGGPHEKPTWPSPLPQRIIFLRWIVSVGRHAALVAVIRIRAILLKAHVTSQTAAKKTMMLVELAQCGQPSLPNQFRRKIA
jgi:hypothetical protein